MQIIFEILRAFASSMTVIDAEYLYIRPVLDHRQFINRMNYVKNNCYPVFIILTNKSNISISTERFNCSKCFVRNLTILEIWESIVERSKSLLLPIRFRSDLLTCQENFSFLHLGHISTLKLLSLVKTSHDCGTSIS